MRALCKLARVIALAAAAAAALPAPAAASRAATKPNILILYADDMGYGDLAIQNPQSKIPTPRLDQLAREGIRFTDAHSSSGICTPSRYALLTGRFHWRKFHGIVNSFEPSVIEPERLTLPEMLRERGYRTACIGKWHLGWNWETIKRPGAKPDPKTGYAPDAFDWSKPVPDGPVAHGFDYYFGDDIINFPPYTWIENDRVLIAPTQPFSLAARMAEGNPECRPGPMAKDWSLEAVLPRLIDQAVEWISRQRHSPQPFFLYVPFSSPHAPIVPTAEFRGRSQAGGYGDFVAQTDAGAGRILDALDAHGFRANTLVIFTSDNGPEGYAYERLRQYGHHSSGGLRGVKRDLWEGGHRVPFIARWPGTIRAGRVSDHLLSQVDLFATLAAVVDYKLEAPAADDSHDFLPVLKRHGARGPRHTIVHNTNPNGYAVRHEQWVLINAKSGGITRVPDWFDSNRGYAPNAHPGELYDLARDPEQRRNLYGEQPAKVAALKRLLDEVRSRGQLR